MSSITECWYNHTPPTVPEMESRNLEYTIDETTPKGVAGWTILAEMRADPTSYGIIPASQWYVDMCALIEDYEDFYFEKMEEVVDERDSLSVTALNKASTLAIHQDIYDLLAVIDEEYFDVAEACSALIPTAVWYSYTGGSQR